MDHWSVGEVEAQRLCKQKQVPNAKPLNPIPIVSIVVPFWLTHFVLEDL